MTVLFWTWVGDYEEDTRPEHEKFFGMGEKEIYEKYGICFTKTDIEINGVRQYKMSSDFEAKLWLIKKGFVKYVRGKEVWNEEALDEGWDTVGHLRTEVKLKITPEKDTFILLKVITSIK